MTGTIGLINGELLVAKNITISGPGAENLAANGNANSTVFHIASGETLTISDLTITNGSAGSGGGVHNDYAALTLNNCTMNGNSIEIWYGGAYIKNTAFKVSPGGHSIVSDGFSTIMSQGYNVSSDDGAGYLNGPGDQINTDPQLGPLQDHGGSTFTHALLPGSPAIDAGDPNFVPPPYYDQRGPGFDRVRGGRIDIGSFEVQEATPTPTSTPRVTPTPRVAPTPRPLPTPIPRP